jgi:hypothetical protein
LHTAAPKVGRSALDVLTLQSMSFRRGRAS